jgi:hypothetical protein
MPNVSHKFESLLNDLLPENLPKPAPAGLLIIQQSMRMLCNLKLLVPY